jgi:T5SS/PEP-CTERM-associated repeat protein
VIFDLYDEGSSTAYTYTQTFGTAGLGLRVMNASELTLNGGKIVSAAPASAQSDGDNAKFFVTGRRRSSSQRGDRRLRPDGATAATGRVEVRNGATWSHTGAADVNIGFGSGASAIGTGVLLVDGSNYTSTSTGRLIVGTSNNGVGTATFQNGSTATLAAALVTGFATGSSGTVNLIGSTTSLTTTSLDIGTSTTTGGTGYLNVTAGADAITSGTGGLNIGHSGAGKYGKVVVDGVGSTISAAALEMGFTTTSTGELEITNGGVVTIRSGSGNVRVGVQAAAVGNVLVQGNATAMSRASTSTRLRRC